MVELNTLSSSRNLEGLMSPSKLRELSLSLAVLEAIILEPEYRFFTWLPLSHSSPDHLYLSNDSGEEAVLAFGEHAQALFLGLGHESALANDTERLLTNMRAQITPSLSGLYDYAAQKLQAGTFCLWYDVAHQRWISANQKFPFKKSDRQKLGLIPLEEYPWFVDYVDGSAYFLRCFDGRPETFKELADENYYNPDVVEEFSLEIIQQIYAQVPLTEHMALTLNPECLWKEARKEVRALGYPVK